MSLFHWKSIIINHLTSNFRTLLLNIVVAILGEIVLFLLLTFTPKRFHKFLV